MWGSKNRRRGRSEGEKPPAETKSLKEAIRQARIETAERSSVVIDLRDAELARLELLNDALEPVFADIPPEVELFDRGLSKSEVPRLWLDAIAYVAMGRDKRVYRFVQETRFGRKLLLESPQVDEVAAAVTRYVAGRLVERERALAGDLEFSPLIPRAPRRRGVFRVFLFGFVLGIAALWLAAWLFPGR